MSGNSCNQPTLAKVPSPMATFGYNTNSNAASEFEDFLRDEISPLKERDEPEATSPTKPFCKKSFQKESKSLPPPTLAANSVFHKLRT